MKSINPKISNHPDFDRSSFKHHTPIHHLIVFICDRLSASALWVSHEATLESCWEGVVEGGDKK